MGRRQEVTEARQLLAESRLVTLTGPGGVGKTRLALRVATETRRAFSDGVWFVELGQLRDPALVSQTVATTLGLRVASTDAPAEVVRDYLAARRVLIVLDNCEHLVERCAKLVDRLLRGCPNVRFLATSRESLAVGAEVTYPVPPLSVPDAPEAGDRKSGVPPAAALERFEAIRLFADRAARVLPGFRMTADNYAAVAEICRRLDGVPLAIELAAARLRVLEPDQILRRLEHPYRLLTTGPRDAPVRHRTLAASMQWSYDLCTEIERRLWTRLSSFAGGFEMEAAEAVGADADLAADDVLDLVGALVDKSVVVRQAPDGDSRLRMLEIVREFGLEKLRDSGGLAATRRRHRDYYVDLVKRVRAEWIGPRQAEWFDRLDREHANLRAALRFCLTEPGEARYALDIMVSVPHQYWWTRGLLAEGRYWLAQALDQVPDLSVSRVRGLLLDAFFAIGLHALRPAALDDAWRLARQLGDPATLAFASDVAGIDALWRGDLPAATRLFEEALALAAGAGDHVTRLHASMALAGTHSRTGDLERTTAYYEAVLRHSEPRGERYFRFYAATSVALAAWNSGDVALAEGCMRDALPASRGLDPRGVASGLEILAWAAAAQHRHRRAAVLLGAAAARWAMVGSGPSADPYLRGHHAECERRARGGLGGAAFDAAFRHGDAMTMDDAFDFALDFAPDSAADAASDGDARRVAAPSLVPARDVLTKRERQVAQLVAEGLTNREIAARLTISQRTAESHVENILAKLGFTSRAQVAAWAVGQAR